MIPTDIDQLLEISDVNLSLSPEKVKKEDISGLDMIVNQTMSEPPKTTSSAKLQLSGGGGDDTNKDISSETFVKAQEEDSVDGRVHSLSQNFGVDLSNNYENKKAVGNLSGNTYVKDDIANLDDFETKP